MALAPGGSYIYLIQTIDSVARQKCSSESSLAFNAPFIYSNHTGKLWQSIQTILLLSLSTSKGSPTSAKLVTAEIEKRPLAQALSRMKHCPGDESGFAPKVSGFPVGCSRDR
jgi:hypothetical protein